MRATSQTCRLKRGKTSFEILLIFAVLAGLGGTITAAVHSYRDGTTRSECVRNINEVQQAVQVFQATNQLNSGDWSPKDQLVGAGKMFPVEPCCPKTGEAYSWSNRIPLPGRALIECPHSKDLGHSPAPILKW